MALLGKCLQQRRAKHRQSMLRHHLDK
jgi:hypothetical protein